MKKIGIVAEEALDLPQETIEKYKIGLVSVKLDWPDLENMSGTNIFEKMRELEKREIKSFGKTSQPSPKDFLNAYKKQFENFEKVLCITITSKLSGSYNSAIQAVKFLPSEQQKKVVVVDSLNASIGQGILVLKAVELIEKGLQLEVIVKKLEQLIPQIYTFIMFKDPKYIEASGRISGIGAKLIRNAAKFGIRPVLTFKNGLLVPAGIKTGAKDIPTGIFKAFERDVKKNKLKDELIVLISHGDDLKGANRLKEMIEQNFNAKIFSITIIDNILGSLCGPETMILAWSEKILL
ncbi:MAG: DegV family protein [Candidatus Nealsonbacteria bacterium]